MTRENKKEELKILAYRLDYLKTYDKHFKVKSNWASGFDLYQIINNNESFISNSKTLSELNTKLNFLFSFLQNEKLADHTKKLCPKGCGSYEHYNECFNPDAKRDIKNLIEAS